MDLSDEELHPLRNPNPTPSHRPTNPTAFKREARKQHRQQKRQRKLQQQLQDLVETLHLQPNQTKPHLPASTTEWPCPPIQSQDPPNWGDFTACPSPPPPPPPSAQQNAVAACKDFLAQSEDGDDDDDEESVGVMEGGVDFFTGLFEKDAGLRALYERDGEKEKGGFVCFVCGAVGEKAGKRFVDVAGLVQHCELVVRTKRRGAHRAFGRAVCRVLGWEGGRPPKVDTGEEDAIVGGGSTSGGPVDTDNRDLPVDTDNGDLMDCLDMNTVTNYSVISPSV